VSAFQKLFLAAALIGAGLGVAYLLGEPAAVKQAVQSASQKIAASKVPALSSDSATGAGLTSSNVRLLPDTSQTNASQAPAAAPPPLFSSSQNSPISIAPISPQPNRELPSIATDVSVNSSALKAADEMPRARLRTEAPRPIGNEPRSPATVRRTPNIQLEDAYAVTSDETTRTIPASWAAPPQLMPVVDGATATSSTTTNAAYDVFAKPVSQAPENSVPWSIADADNGPCTHIIVDGDSLPRLASRYLNDPNRSGEIFELNRDLLTNPELLPIGAELKIPDRTQQASWNRQSQRREAAGTTSVREASRLVPLRPSAPDDNIAPQAHLSGPRAVE